MELNRFELLKQINKIFIEVLDDEKIILDEKSTPNDVEGWDSLTHLHLIVAMEKHFNFHFNSKEVQKIKSVGNLINIIIKGF